MIKRIIFTSLFLLGLAGIVYASWGIGLSAPAKFELGIVRPHKLYEVGRMTIVNTGDEYGCYKMSIAYHQDQPEKRVPKEWVIFEPKEFCLESRKSKLVKVKLFVRPQYRIDRKLVGKYFSYLEGCTYKGWFGVCVASKLYFTINK